jgi:GT2 family glycosyltransferase
LKVSVIVVNWNRRDLLRACLKSLAGQIGAEAEIIVVDNGSADGSVEMVQREFSGIRLIRNRENRGFCVANNQGIEASNADFVALLNNDAEADPTWMQSLLDAFEGRPDYGMAASKILVWENPSVIDKAGHLIYPDGQNRGRGSGEQDRGQ